MSAIAKIEQMITTLEAAKADAEKHDKGQNAAGTRVRKTAQDIKALANELRQVVMDDRNARKVEA